MVAAIRARKLWRMRRYAYPGLSRANDPVADMKPGAALSCDPGTDMPQHGFWKYQLHMRAAYNSDYSVWLVASLIMLNFLANIMEKEIDPSGDLYRHQWRTMEHTFNAIFLVELLINMYAHWLRRFWYSSWNMFDLVVVAVGVFSFFNELDGPLKLLRTLRAFRVFRLFKRIKSLNKSALRPSAHASPRPPPSALHASDPVTPACPFSHQHDHILRPWRRQYLCCDGTLHFCVLARRRRILL